MSNAENSVVVGVMPAFRPTEEILENYVAASRQVDRLIVVDDGSGSEYDDIFSSIEALGGVVIRNSQNLGIAESLNVGVMEAREGGADFVLTMDQDSLLSSDHVGKLLAEYFSAVDAGIRVGLVAPWRISSRPSTKAHTRLRGFILGTEPIQSGQVIPCSTFDDIGYFTGSLFIDCVDTEFYLRAKFSGLSSVFCEAVDLGHSMGEASPARLLGKQVRRGGKPLTIRFHPPVRNYYIFRNGVVLLIRYGLRDRVFLRSSITGMWKRFLLTMLFSPRKLRQFNAISHGLTHGVLRRSGRIPRKLEERWKPAVSSST